MYVHIYKVNFNIVFNGPQGHLPWDNLQIKFYTAGGGFFFLFNHPLIKSEEDFRNNFIIIKERDKYI